jgi:hypothetical protein
VTPDGCRFDLWVEPASQVADSPVRDRRLLFDRDGLDVLVPPPLAPAPPSTARLAELRNWAADCRALISGSAELLRLECVHTLRWILYEAMVELNRPLPPTGLKRWSAKLTPAQRVAFEELPTDDPEPLWSALEDVLGPITPTTPCPSVQRALVMPEGYIRGLYLPELPIGERTRHLAEEFLALHLYLTVVVYRADWLLGVEGIYSLRRLVQELFLESNGRPPAGNGRAWEERLSSAQREELLALPTGQATKNAVIGDHLAIKHRFAGVAHAMLGDDYPADLDRTVESEIGKCLPSVA